MNDEYIKSLEQLGRDIIDCVYDNEGNIIEDNLQYIDAFNKTLGEFRQSHPVEVAKIEAEVRRYEAEKQSEKAKIEATSRVDVAKIEAESRIAVANIEADATKKAATKRMVGEVIGGVIGGVVGLVGIFVNFVNLNTVVYSEEKANRIASSKLLQFISKKP